MIVVAPGVMLKLLSLKLPANSRATWFVPLLRVSVPSVPPEFSLKLSSDHDPARSTKSWAAKLSICEPL